LDEGRFSFGGDNMNALGFIAWFVIIFIVVFLVLRLSTSIKYKRTENSRELSVPLRYIERRFNLKLRETRERKLLLYIDIINTLAVVIPVYLLIFIDLKMNEVIKFASMVGIFILVVIGGYNLLGFIQKRKDEK
jgi:hypothetical protein